MGKGEGVVEIKILEDGFNFKNTLLIDTTSILTHYKLVNYNTERFHAIQCEERNIGIKKNFEKNFAFI